jgi:hypothetical protein
MAKTLKTLQLQNLAKYDVYINDINPTSDYFKVANIPKYFTGGRNSFLIGGSNLLTPYTNVLIEILDSNGNPIFQNPTKKYLQGNSRVISVEINKNTPPGYLTIIILGVANYQLDGKPVPSEWKDKFNVRWVGKVLVEPKLKNTADIIFTNQPEVFCEENRLLEVNTSQFVETSTTFTASLSPILYSSFIKGYLISAVAPTTFSADYYGATITGSMIINGVSASVYLPITNILNDTTAFSEGYLIKDENNKVINKIYIHSGSYTTEILGTTIPVTSSVVLNYKTLSVSGTNIPISYAKLRVVNLNTVSGEVVKTKIYNKVKTNLSDYKLVANSDVVTKELLTTGSSRGEIHISDFISLVPSSSWYVDTMIPNTNNVVYPITGTSSYYNPIYNSEQFYVYSNNSLLLSSMYADIPVNSSNYRFTGQISESGYFIGQKSSITVFPTTEYTFKLNALYKNSNASSIVLTGNTPYVDIYMVGLSGSVIIDKDPLGQKIGRIDITPGSTSQLYQNKEFNFTPKLASAGVVSFRLVVSNGFWNFSDVSVKPASDTTFSPDEFTVLVPNTEFFNNYLEYKIEFFDINNNSTNITAISLPTYFTGSNIDLGVLS